jgi:hypothetical protein
MLHEVTNLTQHDKGKHRRWFHDEYFDLYVWENYAGEIISFQLCYAKDSTQRALRWSDEAGYRHEGVDAPEHKPGRAMSAIFVADGVFDPKVIGARFEHDAVGLPLGIRQFVLQKIRDFPSPA